jgi:hypothetical protein
MNVIKQFERKLKVNLNLDSLLQRGKPEQVYGFLNELYIDPELPIQVRDVAKQMMDKLEKKESMNGIISDKIKAIKEGKNP